MFHSLPVDTSWKDTNLIECLPVILSLLAFVTYWFTLKSAKIKKSFYDKYPFDEAARKHIFFTKVFGFFSLGIIPLTICLIALPGMKLENFGITIIPETTLFSIAWIAGLSVLVMPIAYMSAKKPKNLVNYPEIRSKIWSKKTILIATLGWTLYLLGYEILFRGTLLFPLVNTIGVWPAIAINVAMYSATHIPKGLDETVGAMFLGFVLCLLTLYSGTIWIAVIVHIVMALTNCFTALKFHPDIHYKADHK